MKSNNTLALAALLALTGAGLASAATTTWHISGSSAYRSAFVSAEVNYAANLTGSNPYVVYYGSPQPTDLSAAGQSVVESSDGSVIFENNFTGAIQAVEAVSELGSTIAFPTGAVTSAVNTASGAFSTSNNNYKITALATPSTVPVGGVWAGDKDTNITGGVVNAYPDIATTDVSASTAFQFLSQIPGAPSTLPSTVSEATYPNGYAGLGIVPYLFVANATPGLASTEFANVNITPENFDNLYSKGLTSGSVFTGVSGDTGIKVYAIGRDIDSGTRAAALAETGYGQLGNGPSAIVNSVKQYYPEDASSNIIGNVNGAGQIAKFAPTAGGTVDGVAGLPTGDGGYNSATPESIALTQQYAATVTNTVEIGYLGLADVSAALNGDTGTNRQAPIQLGFGGSRITVLSTTSAGQLSAADQQKVEYGQYTYWSYDHLYFANNNGNDPTSLVNGTSGLVALLEGSGANNLDTIASGGIDIGAVKVTRTDDGLVVK